MLEEESFVDTNSSFSSLSNLTEFIDEINFMIMDFF